jgi:PGF-pre-PGF domain-containing protein
MPPVHRDPGSLGYKTGNFSGDSEVNLVRIIGWDTDCVVAAQQVTFLPDNLSPPPGLVYRYINVTPSRCPVVSGVLEFDVPPSFIEENQATPNDVKLCLVRNLSWTCLITNAQGMKNDFVRYHAICPEFSLFAVTLSNETQGVPGGVVFTTQPAAPEYTPSDPAIPVISRSALSAATTDPDEGNSVVPVGIVAMVLCVLAIAVIVIFSTGNWR